MQYAETKRNNILFPFPIDEGEKMVYVLCKYLHSMCSVKNGYEERKGSSCRILLKFIPETMLPWP